VALLVVVLDSHTTHGRHCLTQQHRSLLTPEPPGSVGAEPGEDESLVSISDAGKVATVLVGGTASTVLVVGSYPTAALSRTRWSPGW